MNIEHAKETINLRHYIESETGTTFNSQGMCKCPLPHHHDKTASLKYYAKTNSYHCFGCGSGGTIIDFVKDYHGVDFVRACDILGIEKNEEAIKAESQLEMVTNLAKTIHKDKKVVHIYTFKSVEGNILYYKVKLIDEEGKKITPYFSFEGNKVVAKRGCAEVPYRLKELMSALQKDKTITVVEGEKDADNLSRLGYTAVSFKGVSEFDFTVFQGKDINFIADTGKAGTEYMMNFYYKVKAFAKSFNVVELPNVKALGDNKDVTDWLLAGHTKAELDLAVRDAWDYQKSRMWKHVGVSKKGDVFPLKVWGNLELLLERENITLKYNEINKEIECYGSVTSTRNELQTDIYTLQVLRGLNMGREEISHSLDKIAKKNKYNPFVDYLVENRNNNWDVIEDVFNCLILDNNVSIEDRDRYFMYFKKWLLNIVKMSQNTLTKNDVAQGALILQGGQGIRKSTYFRELLPNRGWFKGDESFDPHNKDDVARHTSYVLVEWGELDSTLKGEQAKLKQFMTAPSDEYRAPYARCSERYPRKTVFCGSVNQVDFLKDKTGSRRFWVIPVVKTDIESLKSIDLSMFWGAIYDMWLSGQVVDYLDEEETAELNSKNMVFAAISDASLAVDEIMINTIEGETDIYSIGHIAGLTGITGKTQLKNELERRGYVYKTYRDENGKAKKGFKMPKFTESLLKDKGMWNYATKKITL